MVLQSSACVPASQQTGSSETGGSSRGLRVFGNVANLPRRRLASVFVAFWRARLALHGPYPRLS